MPPARAPRGLTVDELAGLVGGEIVGPADGRITGASSLAEAGPEDVAFLASSRWLPAFERSRAGVVLVAPGWRDRAAGPRTRIVVEDPRHAIRRVVTCLTPAAPAWGVHHTARLGRGVQWSGRLAVGPHAVVGDGVRLGADCIIGAHAYVAPETRLGNRVVLAPGARIGTPGFALLDAPGGPRQTIPHAGGCTLEDGVEVGANTTIDRGSLGATRIGAETKIDNLVQIGHNVRIGRRCIIMAQVGIAGTTTIGDDVILAGQAGLAGQLTVGAGARVAAQAGVIGDVPAGATVSGYPARPHRSVLRQAAALQRLTPLASHLERLVTATHVRAD